MRIVCQKCGATYEMDERLLRMPGVRSQCPNCKHQQTLLPDPATATPRPGSVGAALGSARPRTLPRGVAAPRIASPPGGLQLDTGAPPRPEPPPPEAAVVQCQRCGKSLTDPFDQSLGMCDSCRQELADQKAMEAASAARPEPHAELRADPPRPRAHSRPQGVPLATSPPRSTLSGGVPRTSSGAGHAVLHGVALTATGRSWLKPVAIAAAALVAAGGVAAGVTVLMRRARPEETPRIILEVLPRWRLEFTDLHGAAPPLLAEGKKRLQEDRPAAYRDAEETFQRALLLDPRSDEAIAGYGLALALGRAESMDEETRREAIALVEAARQRGGETVPELLAEVHLLLARSPNGEDLQNARQLAQRALAVASDHEKGEALMALGRSFVATSGQLAVHNFDLALRSAFAPPRTHYYRGLAHASVGEFRQAISDLERRLELDPGQPEALVALAGIYEELGSPEHARQVYLRAQRAHPEDARIPVQLAVLMYQFEGRAKEAAAALRAALKDEDRLEREVALDGYVHLAAAERSAGNLDGAAAAAWRALTISKDDAAAHLQLLWVALQRNHADEAAVQHLPFLRGHLDDGALEHVVAGKVAMAQGRFAEAVREYGIAVEQDDRRVDAMLGAGVAAARDHHKNEALSALFRAVQGDPTRSAPRRPVTRFWLAEGETLEGLDGTVAQLSSNASDVMPLVYEGVIRFHQGALADADRLFARVVEEDGKNSLALSFRALVALERGETGKAIVFAQKAALNGTRLGISHYAFGMALAARGELDDAKRQFREASTLLPGVLASEVRLAELEARKPGEVAAARERLVRCLALDSTYVSAKRALYALERREPEKKP
ncbi:MAG TPA: tetratricopeptide repeat protein [Myxococcales bacterium]|nr:tetratricopeptide repeat protein [Myxococcales bacterium]